MGDTNANDVLTIVTQVTCALVPLLLDDEPQALHNLAWTGRMKVEELMDPRRTNNSRFREVNRMDRRTFRRLLNFLHEEGGYTDSRRVSADEHLMIFIHTLRSFSQEIWIHSTECSIYYL